MIDQDHPIIASRTLKCVSSSGKQGKVVIEITIPKRDKKSRDWSCDCRITGIAESKDKTVYGVDSLQCLVLVTDMVRVQLGFFEKRGFKFSWLGSAGFGLNK